MCPSLHNQKSVGGPHRAGRTAAGLRVGRGLGNQKLAGDSSGGSFLQELSDDAD